MKSINYTQKLKLIYISLVLLTASQAHAFSWSDLWQTHDQKARIMMDKGQYADAQKTFDNDNWRATAAFRAGNYQQAASLYESLNNAEALYNAGNSLANMQKYDQALKSYDKALALDHNNQDAIFNRQIVEKLLKKQQQNQKNDSQQNQSDKQQKQDNSQQKNNSDNNQNKNQDQSQDKDLDKNKDQTPNPKSDNKEADNNKDNESKKPNDPLQNESKEKDPDIKDKQQEQSTKSATDKEKREANDQWLRLIPDDPGGLLREKFLRDYVRRRGNGQL